MSAHITTAPANNVSRNNVSRNNVSRDRSAGDSNPSRCQVKRAIDLMRRQQDGGAGARGVGDEHIDEVSATRVETGVGFVEQPQLGAAHDNRGKRYSPSLTGREEPNRHIVKADGNTESIERRRNR
jgi:hypothetical protein